MNEEPDYAPFYIKPSERQKKTIEYVRKFCEELFDKSLEFMKVKFVQRGSRLYKVIEKSLGKGPIRGALLGLDILLFPSKRRELYIDVLLEEFVHGCRPKLSEDEARELTLHALPVLLEYLRTNQAFHGCISPWAREILKKESSCLTETSYASSLL